MGKHYQLFWLTTSVTGRTTMQRAGNGNCMTSFFRFWNIL